LDQTTTTAATILQEEDHHHHHESEEEEDILQTHRQGRSDSYNKLSHDELARLAR
jgi:hypothetical protein